MSACEIFKKKVAIIQRVRIATFIYLLIPNGSGFRLNDIYIISLTVNRNPQHLDIISTQRVDIVWCKHYLFQPMTWVILITDKPFLSGLFVVIQTCSLLNKDFHLCLGFCQLTQQTRREINKNKNLNFFIF